MLRDMRALASCLLLLSLTGDQATVAHDESTYGALLKEFPGRAGAYIDQNEERGRAAAAQFFAFAREHRDAPEAVEALGWVASHRIFDADAGEAMTWIAKDHAKSSNLAAILRELDRLYGDPFGPHEAMLRVVLKDSPHLDVRGTAALCLARELLAKRTKAERDTIQYDLAMKGAKVPFVAKPVATDVDLDHWSDEAAALCEAIEGEPTYSDRLRDDAGATLRQIRDLAIGSRAPEIEGRDHEGKPFRLSDFQGKVILLTFDSSGCGGCVAMYPTKRQMINRYKGQPFATVSIYCDDNLGYLKRAIGSGEITWRSWCDGGADGPISRQWNVSGYPTIYVIDGGGVIRHRFTHGFGLEETIERMVGEAEKQARQ